MGEKSVCLLVLLLVVVGVIGGGVFFGGMRDLGFGRGFGILAVTCLPAQKLSLNSDILCLSCSITLQNTHSKLAVVMRSRSTLDKWSSS